MESTSNFAFGMGKCFVSVGEAVGVNDDDDVWLKASRPVGVGRVNANVKMEVGNGRTSSSLRGMEQRE